MYLKQTVVEVETVKEAQRKASIFQKVSFRKLKGRILVKQC